MTVCGVSSFAMSTSGFYIDEVDVTRVMRFFIATEDNRRRTFGEVYAPHAVVWSFWALTIIV